MSEKMRKRRKRKEKSMRKDQSGEVFKKIFDLDVIQKIQDSFTEATGVASIITTTDGVPLTRPSNFCFVCENMIRKVDLGRQNCYRSDRIVGQYRSDGPTISKCFSAGLWNAGSSIRAGEMHVANWLVGQVRNEETDLKEMERYARVIDIEDIDLFRNKCNEITTMSIEQFTKIADFLFILSDYISATAFRVMSQQSLIDELREKQEKQEKKINIAKRKQRTFPRFMICSFCCICYRWILKKCMRSFSCTCFLLLCLCLATIPLSSFFLAAMAIKIGLSYAIDPYITHWASLTIPIPFIPLFLLFPIAICFFHVVCLRPVMSLLSRRLDNVARLDLDEPKSLSCCDQWRVKCVLCCFSSTGQIVKSTNRLRDQMNVFVTLVPSYILENDLNNSSESQSNKSDGSSGSWEKTTDSTFFLSRELKLNALEMFSRSNVFLMKLVIWNFRQVMSSHFRDDRTSEFVTSFEKLAHFIEESATKFKGTVERWSDDGSILISWNLHRLIPCVSKESGINKTAELVMKLASHIIRFLDINLKNLFSVGLFGSFGSAWIGSLGSSRNRNFHIQGPIAEKIRRMQRLVGKSQKKNNNKKKNSLRKSEFRTSQPHHGYDENAFFFDDEIGIDTL